MNKDVEGTRVSIYNERTQAKFPLLGLKFKNTSGLHLMQGPITVFEGSNYAGDARILDLQPNEERLLSYAIDLGTEVNPVPSTDNGRIVEVKAVKGVIWTTTKIRETKTYTIKNRNDQERLVLVEHPVRNDFHLIDGVKPAETASDFYRFEVKVAPGKNENLAVTEEKHLRPGGRAVQQQRRPDPLLHQPGRWPARRSRTGLQKAMELRWELNKTQREIGELERQLKVITDDQVRLRANLKEMPATAAAYKRYLQKFDEQETQIEKYQADVKKLQGVEHEQKKAFEDFLANFNADLIPFVLTLQGLPPDRGKRRAFAPEKAFGVGCKLARGRVSWKSPGPLGDHHVPSRFCVRFAASGSPWWWGPFLPPSGVPRRPAVETPPLPPSRRATG